MYLAWLALAHGAPMVVQEATIYHRPLRATGPHRAVDDEPSTVWEGKRNERASFWLHEHTASQVVVTGCASGTVKVRSVWTDYGIGPWTEVTVQPGTPSPMVAFDPTKRVQRIQVQLLDAHCVAAVAVEGTPRPVRRRRRAHVGYDRAEGIHYTDAGDGACEWYGNSGSAFQFRGPCTLTDEYWALSGSIVRQATKPPFCWMPGMPVDFPASGCPSEYLAERWPVQRVNKCMVVVNGRTFGSSGCW